MGWVKRPVWIISPFVRVRGASDHGILVEVDEVLVLDSGQVGIAKIVELGNGLA
jgi:hypothetical protein